MFNIDAIDVELSWGGKRYRSVERLPGKGDMILVFTDMYDLSKTAPVKVDYLNWRKQPIIVIDGKREIVTNYYKTLEVIGDDLESTDNNLHAERNSQKYKWGAYNWGFDPNKFTRGFPYFIEIASENISFYGLFKGVSDRGRCAEFAVESQLHSPDDPRERITETVSDRLKNKDTPWVIQILFDEVANGNITIKATVPQED